MADTLHELELSELTVASTQAERSEHSELREERVSAKLGEFRSSLTKRSEHEFTTRTEVQRWLFLSESTQTPWKPRLAQH